MGGRIRGWRLEEVVGGFQLCAEGGRGIVDMRGFSEVVVLLVAGCGVARVEEKALEGDCGMGHYVRASASLAINAVAGA